MLSPWSTRTATASQKVTKITDNHGTYGFYFMDRDGNWWEFQYAGEGQGTGDGRYDHAFRPRRHPGRAAPPRGAAKQRNAMKLVTIVGAARGGRTGVIIGEEVLDFAPPARSCRSRRGSRRRCRRCWPQDAKVSISSRRLIDRVAAGPGDVAARLRATKAR